MAANTRILRAVAATPDSRGTDHRETEPGIEIKPVYTAADAPRRARAARRIPLHARPIPGHVPRPAVDDAPVRRLRLGRGVERALPLPARPRADGPLDRLRPADPARLRLGRPARARRGGAHRRRDRLARRHGAPARRHPARRGVDVDDDQRAGRAAAPPLRARRRGAGRRAGGAARHRPERHPQGVHRARELHLPAEAVDAADDGSLRVLRGAHPAWNTISISGYHIREAGSTAVQELAFTLANGIAYAQAAVDAGLSPDDFGARLSFFFNAHNNFFQEVAKFRAARRLWARIMARAVRRHEPEGAGAALPRADRRLDADGAAAGEQHRPRRDPGALGRLPAARSRCTRTRSTRRSRCRRSTRRGSRSERSRSSPPRRGATDTVDPLGGSYFIEALTDELEQAAWKLIERIDELGGAVAAVEQGFVQRRDRGVGVPLAASRSSPASAPIVGVNRYVEDAGEDDRAAADRPGGRAPPAGANRTASGPSATPRRPRRRSRACGEAARGTENLLPPMREALRARCTVGEICEVLREEWGMYDRQVAPG